MEKTHATIILFGGTGDLTKRKLVPAFASLVHNNILSKSSTIIGVSRKPLTDEEYTKFLVESESNNQEKSHIRHLNIRYFQGDFTEKNGLEGLKELINKCEKESSNRIFYLSTSFKFFPNIVDELKRLHLHKNPEGFTRVAFEKPFGKNLASSEKLDKEIHDVFEEKEVYRIDHYLAKETVQNINILKFTNPILYSTFNKDYVSSIKVVTNESVGVGNRIEYYNESGALKDMVQNHLLQMLSLILMERPKHLDSSQIHDEKVKILKNLTLESTSKQLLGQYESYSSDLKEKKLEDNKTETFAKINLNCRTEKWDGVKIELQTGKKLKEKESYIHIIFKMPIHDFTHDFEGVNENSLEIKIFPKQDVILWLNTRNSEDKKKVKPVKFEFCQECEFGPNTKDEYATLMQEILKGDKTLFTRSDEVRESWEIIEKIEKMKDKIKFVRYKDGSDADEIK